MFIRMMMGRYAGEIRDVREEEAHGLIARGQAQNPYAAPPIIAPPVIAAPETKQMPKYSFKSKGKR